MNKIHTTLGRWVQLIAGKNKPQGQARSAARPTEFDAQSLRHVGGGSGGAQSPNKGW